MPPALFLQSDVLDPYDFYITMLKENPVFWDEDKKLWAIYSYKDCVSVLTNVAAQIPPVNQNNKDGLNEYALLITGHLARLSNNVQHTIAREIAVRFFQNIKKISIKDIVDELLKNKHIPEIDFVNSICKQLPVMVVLKSFDFDDEDADFICSKMEKLVKIMFAVKTIEQVKHVNEIAKEIYILAEKHALATGVCQPIIKSLNEKYKIEPGELMAGCVSNLIGLFIQAYDAGRGILSNALLQILKNNNTAELALTDKTILEKSIIETLRFDPPVQNTRRIAVENILLNDVEIKKGETVLIVLAAANRDPEKFNRPADFDINRTNNAEHLTFGFSHHQCVAKQFSVYMATETLGYFFERYKIKPVEKIIQYEPVVNVRLPMNLWISLS